MYTYKLEITDIYDGDTLNGVVDLGFNIRMDIKVRLARINTPEIRTKDLEEKAAGYAARDFLRNLVKEHLENGGWFLVRTVERGKYGRWIGELLYDNNWHEPHNVNDLLVEQGFAEYKEY